MNIAWIISAYRLPELLIRLVDRLDHAGSSFFIHVDAKTNEREYRAMTEPLANRSNVLFLERHECWWGDFGHVRATLKGIRALIESGRPFDYISLMTGQDYPLKSTDAIAARLAEDEGRVFMQASRLPNPHWTEGGLDRIEHWHFRVGRKPLSFPGSPFRPPLANTLWSLPARLLRLRRRFPAGMEPWGGGSYWCMPADCVRHVDSFVRANPDFVGFFRYVHEPDEIFFQTIVMNSPFRDRVANDNLRFLDWDADGDHPEVLTMHDLERLVRSDSLFARKFDPGVDETVLDRLDSIMDG
jgi:hypothetical protein